MDKFLILCGADSNRYSANINHEKYAKSQNVEYKFIIKEGINNPFFIKPYCISEALEQGYTHILCIDDDAFFINHNWNFKEVFNTYEHDLIVTRGRAKKSGTTYFNAGIMFIRNTENMKLLFSKTPNVPAKEYTKNWKSEWGPCTGNEQPRLIYLTQTLFPESVKVIDYPGFNACEIEFHKSKNFLSTSPPIVHITGRNKEGKLKRFINDTGIHLP